MRNNDERIGAIKQSDSPAPSQMGQLNFVLPTEFVELPSKGKFYKEGHPLHNQEAIEIKQMTAKEEDILTSQSLLKQGVAIDRLIQSIIVDKSIDIDSLIVGDKNAILIAARMSGYGDEYDTKISCPSCGTQSEVPVSLSDSRKASEGYIESEAYEPLEGVTGPNALGNYLITLPSSKAVFEVKVMDGRGEKEFTKRIEARRKKQQQEALLTDQFKVYTVSINGVSDLRQIYAFIDQLPVKDSRFLRNTYSKIVPLMELKYDFFCTNCTHEQEVTVPMTAQFFWPDA